jgi:agmatinase
MRSVKQKPPFFGTRFAKFAKGSNAAVFGAGHGTPYRGIDNKIHASSADAFRKALGADADWLSHWDFDFDAPLFPDANFLGVDLGNLLTKAIDGKGNRKKIEDQTRKILSAGSVPIMFGGDDSTPIPFISGFSGGPPITILQIDAHIDWRDERLGERQGFSSTMRRASEMPHVWRIVQVGARGIGSARQEEVQAARDWGGRIIPAKQILSHGIAQVLEQIEPHSHCLISLDLDGLDSSIMPAVSYPTPGGLTYHHVTELIAGVAAKARIAGFAMVEFVPKKDVQGFAAFTAARIAAQVLGHIARHKK